MDSLFEVSVFVGERIGLVGKQYLTDLLGQEAHLGVVVVHHHPHVREQMAHVGITDSSGVVSNHTINCLLLSPVLVQCCSHVFKHLISSSPFLCILEVSVCRITSLLHRV
jgi:hypothetical protein